MAAGGRGRGPAGFTLLEILMAVALLGLLAAALISGAMHLIDGRPRSTAEVFWEAAREARRTALKTETTVLLRFDDKDKAFVVEAPEGAVKQFAVPEASRDLAVNFMPARSANGPLLIGGVLVESQSVPSVSFYGDGTCVPFRVQFRTTGPAQVIAIDPWTCAPVLVDEKKT